MHHGRQVAVRGRHDAHVDVKGRVSADALEPAVLEDAQQPHLRRRRQFSHLVQEQRAAVGPFEPALPGLDRPGERPLLVPELAGHSLWKYIADTYGASVIPNIIYLTKINKNSNTGFLYVLGLSIKDLSYEWLGYFLDLYQPGESAGSIPEQNKVFKKTKKTRVYQQVKVSPDGRYIAYVTNELGQYRIFLYDNQTQKNRQILKREFKLDQITDYSYPVLAWHPSGKILAFVSEKKGEVIMTYYTLEDKKFSDRIMDLYDKILDFSYSNDGFKFNLGSGKRPGGYFRP
jgi:WD40 repeat protein